MMLDLSVGKQAYVEDCEVCCNPIEISYTVADEELAEFFCPDLGRLPHGLQAASTSTFTAHGCDIKLSHSSWTNISG